MTWVTWSTTCARSARVDVLRGRHLGLVEALPGRWTARRAVGEALDGAANGLVRVVVPELLWAEVTNVLLRRERSGSIAPEEVRALIDVLQSLPITTFGHGPLVHRALDLARVHGLTTYDALFLALAGRASAHLLTADAKLARAALAEMI